MKRRVRRSRDEPIREGLSWAERWRGADKGLIACWEAGRAQRLRQPDLAERASRDELPPLCWKGGVDKKIKKGKYGTLNYLAHWAGLRGEDLDLDLSQEYELTCARTGMTVTFTGDKEKWRAP